MVHPRRPSRASALAFIIVQAASAAACSDTDGAPDAPVTSRAETGSTTDVGSQSQTGTGSLQPEESTTGGDTLCEDACALDVECGWWADHATCERDCESQLGNGDPDCVDAVVAYRQCETTTTCADHSEDCGSALNHVADTCNFLPEDQCNVLVGTEADASSCFVESMCGGEPKQFVDCDDETCTCIEGGRPLGSCPVGSFCTEVGPDANPDQIQEIVETFISECCGF